MKLRLYSDLHTEFEPFDMPEVPDEKDTVLILAGDCFVARKNNLTRMHLPEWCERHKAVVYVPGNHEYYGGAMPAAWQGMVEDYGWTPNLHMLNNQSVEIDGVLFIGATLWTLMDAMTAQLAGVYMNDYRVIRKREHGSDDDQGKLKPVDTMACHMVSKQFIFDQLDIAKHSDLATVVVTHHAPSPKSIASQYVDSDINGAYYTDLEKEIIDAEPELWVHGHVHSGFDYMVGDQWTGTRVMANPKGYPNRSGGGYENPDFIVDGMLPVTAEPCPYAQEIGGNDRLCICEDVERNRCCDDI